jgi:hypothetical protein
MSVAAVMMVNVVWSAQADAMTLQQARQAKGNALAQMLGSSRWSFHVTSCELRESRNGAVTVIPMSQLDTITFGQQGASAKCVGTNGCMRVSADNRQVGTQNQRLLMGGTTYESSVVANLADQTMQLCKLPASASSQQITNASNWVNANVRTFIMMRRANLFEAVKARIGARFALNLSTCVITEMSPDQSSQTQAPLKVMKVLPVQQNRLRVECNQGNCVTATMGGQTGSTNNLSWTMSGTSAQQTQAYQRLAQLKSWCSADDVLPGVF